MSNNEVGSPLFSLSEVFCPAIRILAGGCWVESQILNLKSTTECLTLHENKAGREKQKLLSEFLTSLLEIPCSILDIHWVFLLACHNENCCIFVAIFLT